MNTVFLLMIHIPSLVWVILLALIGALSWILIRAMRPAAAIQTSACPACGHTVSSQAPACPACGQPLKARGMWGFKLVIGIIFVLLALWLLWSSWQGVQEGINGEVHFETHMHK